MMSKKSVFSCESEVASEAEAPFHGFEKRENGFGISREIAGELEERDGAFGGEIIEFLEFRADFFVGVVGDGTAEETRVIEFELALPGEKDGDGFGGADEDEGEHGGDLVGGEGVIGGVVAFAEGVEEADEEELLHFGEFGGGADGAVEDFHAFGGVDDGGGGGTGCEGVGEWAFFFVAHGAESFMRGGVPVDQD